MPSPRIPTRPHILLVMALLWTLGLASCGDQVSTALPEDADDVLDVSVDVSVTLGLCGSVSCGVSELCCDDICIDPLRDDTACGHCGNTCHENESCV